jgi:hypothetical protein
LTERAKKIGAQIELLKRNKSEPSKAEQNIIDALKVEQRSILAMKKDERRINQELEMFKRSQLRVVDIILTTLCFSGNKKMEKYFEGKIFLSNKKYF